jgi:hypothetical protein
MNGLVVRLPLPTGEGVGVRDNLAKSDKSKRGFIDVWGKPWPLTPALSPVGRGSG